MQYVSTRGNSPALDFAGVLTAGLAPDGGLYVPEFIPQFSKSDIENFANLSYADLTWRIVSPFIGDAIPKADFDKLAQDAYGTFRHSSVAPLKQLSHNQFVMELFHGPTLAFKDFALQLLGRMLDYVLSKQKQDVVIIGATSGDTGSAAIEGCRASKHIKLFMLSPNGRVTDVQRRQMTTVIAPHIHNLSVEGSFDDCQNMVKALFVEPDFLPGTKLVAVNSINWARIMAQIVYYFWAALHLGAPHRGISFSVPTGNFGDVYAGYIAHRMGLPIEKLIVATNRNDILNRFFRDNDYSQKGVTPSLSPSMDIQISSNFERLLYDLHGKDGKKVASLMQQFKDTKSLKVDEKVFRAAHVMFASEAVNDNETTECIRAIYAKTGEVLDPHTAIGVEAARRQFPKPDHPVVTLATASPAKFPDAVKNAIGFAAPLPKHLEAIMTAEEKFTVLPNDLKKIREFIAKNVS